jgi:hypothetical protein
MRKGVTAPVALFVFNRPAHTARTLNALSGNRGAGDVELHVFCDGPRESDTPEAAANIRKVREIVASQSWCDRMEVHESDVNLGLARSIRNGVDYVLASHDRVIVLEDDIETSPGFLQYMNAALDTYENRTEVMHVTGYLPASSYEWMLPDTFFARYMNCWGWGTWGRAWANARWNAEDLLEALDNAPGGRRTFNLDGTADFSGQLEANLRGDLRTWAVFWAASIYLAQGLCLFPGRSLVRNTGTDGTGQHFTTDQTARYNVSLADSIPVKSLRASESARGRAYLRAFHRFGRDAGITRRVKIALGRGKHRLAMRLR